MVEYQDRWQPQPSHQQQQQTLQHRLLLLKQIMRRLSGVGKLYATSGAFVCISWWPGREYEVFHAQTRLSGDREGLLIDIGGYDNLMGDHWLSRVKAHAAKAGKKTILEEQSGLNSVCGVGGSSYAVRTIAT
eukprot:445823-Prorocentrum_lima.AAC.1